MYDRNYVNGNSKNDGGNCDKCEENVILVEYVCLHMVLSQK